MGNRLRNYGWLLGLSGFAFALLLAPFSQSGRIERALMDLCHAPLFFLLAWCLGKFLAQSASVWLRGVLIWIVVAGIGLSSELLQSRVGRHPSWQDAAADLLGAAAGVVWSLPLPAYRFGIRIAAVLLVAIALLSPLTILADALAQRWQMPMLASFESPLELSRWSFQSCRAKRVQANQTAGDWALQVDLAPAQYPGLAIEDVPPDWTGSSQFAFDVTLESQNPLLLIVKITDEAHNWEPHDRFHDAAHLQPGLNRIRIPMREIEHAPKGRLMDLSRIKMLQFFTVEPRESVRIYLDNIRLIPAYPDEEIPAWEVKASLLSASLD